jgi:hypothetical protein
MGATGSASACVEAPHLIAASLEFCPFRQFPPVSGGLALRRHAPVDWED